MKLLVGAISQTYVAFQSLSKEIGCGTSYLHYPSYYAISAIEVGCLENMDDRRAKLALFN